MSALLGTAAEQVIGFNVGINDESLHSPEYKTLGGNFVSQTPMDHADILWPRSQRLTILQPAGGNGGMFNPDHAAQAWEWNVYTTGSRHRMVFTGQTLNASGAPLGGCTVQLYNTATGLLVDTQVSDSGGNYKVTDPNNVACFIVAYLLGSPDVAGTTIDELTGV